VRELVEDGLCLPEGERFGLADEGVALDAILVLCLVEYTYPVVAAYGRAQQFGFPKWRPPSRVTISRVLPSLASSKVRAGESRSLISAVPSGI
jgi:hypothetical protein